MMHLMQSTKWISILLILMLFCQPLTVYASNSTSDQASEIVTESLTDVIYNDSAPSNYVLAEASLALLHPLFASGLYSAFTVTLLAEDGEIVQPGKDPATSLDIVVEADGTYPELPVPTREYHTFLGWVGADGIAVVQGTPVMMNHDPETDTYRYGDHTLTAKWEANRYPFILHANGGSLIVDGVPVDSATIELVYASMFDSLPVPERRLFSFVGWSTVPNLYNDETMVLPTTEVLPENLIPDSDGNYSLYAVWEHQNPEIILSAPDEFDTELWYDALEVPLSISVSDDGINKIKTVEVFVGQNSPLTLDLEPNSATTWDDTIQVSSLCLNENVTVTVSDTGGRISTATIPSVKIDPIIRVFLEWAERFGSADWEDRSSMQKSVLEAARFYNQLDEDQIVHILNSETSAQIHLLRDLVQEITEERTRAALEPSATGETILFNYWAATDFVVLTRLAPASSENYLELKGAVEAAETYCQVLESIDFSGLTSEHYTTFWELLRAYEEFPVLIQKLVDFIDDSGLRPRIFDITDFTSRFMGMLENLEEPPFPFEQIDEKILAFVDFQKASENAFFIPYASLLCNTDMADKYQRLVDWLAVAESALTLVFPTPTGDGSTIGIEKLIEITANGDFGGDFLQSPESLEILVTNWRMVPSSVRSSISDIANNGDSHYAKALENYEQLLSPLFDKASEISAQANSLSAPYDVARLDELTYFINSLPDSEDQVYQFLSRTVLTQIEQLKIDLIAAGTAVDQITDLENGTLDKALAASATHAALTDAQKILIPDEYLDQLNAALQQFSSAPEQLIDAVNRSIETALAAPTILNIESSILLYNNIDDSALALLPRQSEFLDLLSDYEIVKRLILLIEQCTPPAAHWPDSAETITRAWAAYEQLTDRQKYILPLTAKDSLGELHDNVQTLQEIWNLIQSPDESSALEQLHDTMIKMNPDTGMVLWPAPGGGTRQTGEQPSGDLKSELIAKPEPTTEPEDQPVAVVAAELQPGVSDGSATEEASDFDSNSNSNSNSSADNAASSLSSADHNGERKPYVIQPPKSGNKEVAPDDQTGVLNTLEQVVPKEDGDDPTIAPPTLPAAPDAKDAAQPGQISDQDQHRQSDSFRMPASPAWLLLLAATAVLAICIFLIWRRRSETV